MSDDFYDLVSFPGVAGGTIGDLSDVTITTPAQGDVLYYNGTKWVNLVTGTAGTPLLAGGAAANPYYATTMVVDIINPSGTTLTVNDDAEITGDVVLGGDLEIGGSVTNEVTAGLQWDFLSGLKTDTILEVSDATGVTIDGALIQDGGATFSGAVNIDGAGLTVTNGGLTVSTAAEFYSTATFGGVVDAQANMQCGGILTVDVINEQVNGEGVTVEGVLIEDGDVTLAGDLTGVDEGNHLFVKPEHAGATDTRTGLSNFDPNRPYLTVQAAIDDAVSGDVIKVSPSTAGVLSENLTISGKNITISGTSDVVAIFGSVDIVSCTVVLENLLTATSAVGMSISGVNPTINCYNCQLGTTLFGASKAIADASSSTSLTFHNSKVEGSTDSTMNGGNWVMIEDSYLDVGVTGTGSITVYQGSGLDLSEISGPTVSYTNKFDVYLGDSISEDLTVNGNLTVVGAFLRPVTSVTTTAYASLITDSAILVDDDTAGGAVTVALLAAATAGDGFVVYVKKLGSTANVVIDGDGSEEIDGATTKTLTTQYESLTLVCDGTSWHII